MPSRAFNHDIRFSEVAQTNARTAWPTVAHALINEDLISTFGKYETSAKTLKRGVQVIGTLSVLVTLVALLGTSVELYNFGRDSTEQLWTLSGAQLSGMATVGLVLAWLSSRYGGLRRAWLTNRFIAEVLRQWHFRGLLDAAGIMNARLSSTEMTKFVDRRKAELSKALDALTSTPAQRMDALREDGLDPLGPLAPVLAKPTQSVAELFEAYRDLRILHQHDFAIYKLSADDRTLPLLPMKAVVSISGGVASATLLLALVAKALFAFSHGELLVLGAIGLTVLGVGVRAWRDGLALPEEIEHYEEMRHRFGELRTRWDHSVDDAAKFALMKEIENSSVQELRAFLRIHDRARFVL